MKKMPTFMSNYSRLFTKSQILEKIIPRHIENEEQLKSFNPYLLRNFKNVEIESINKGILTPIYDLMDRGGKRWRPVLGMVFAECYGVNVAYHIENPAEKQSINYSRQKSILYACGLTEIVHNGSLMVDDFEDKSLKRRGKPCTYIKYGEDVAVNTGTLMYYAPTIKMAEFVECEKTRYACQKIYQEEMLNIHFGQNWDICWHNGSSHMPTEQQYLDMVINKTSVLPRMCIRIIGAIMNEGRDDEKNFPTEHMVKYIETLGAAFQIQDDLIAIISEVYQTERGCLCEDIHEGKRTLMVINSLQSDQISEVEKQRLVSILDMRTLDEALLQEAIDLLYKSGSVQYTQDTARNMLKAAWEELEHLLPANEGRQKLEELSLYLVDRDL